MAKIRLLDCTLRDGAYIVESQFGSAAIQGIIKKMQDAGVDIIECGWLKNTPHEEGSSFYHVPHDLEHYLIQKNRHAIYTVMIDWDRYDLSYLPECDGKSIDAIRVVFPHGKHKEGIAVGAAIKEKGYRIFFQAANTLAYSNEDLVSLAEEINKVKPEGLSIVDTFGAMYNPDLERIAHVLDEHLDADIRLGFHSHNNQQLSFALTIHFTEMFAQSDREIIVDASLCGMGRGAGNTTTELLASYLNRQHHANYDMNLIMDAIDMYMERFRENYEWGYSTPYFIAGMYCCHVNNIAYLLKNHRTNAQDMRNIIESLSPEDRRKYDYDLLEEKYIENQDRKVDDEAAIEQLKAEFAGRTILLIAPGKTSVTEADRIQAYIKKENPIVIGVNAANPLYHFDYFFIINSVRYDYAKEIYPKQFAESKKILLSSIKTEPEKDEIIVNFNRVIKRGWTYFDNAVIDCLRLMDRLRVGHVVIAGFDGFKTKYNESYADAALPTLNPDNDWDKLNRETTEMYVDFRETTKDTMRVDFLTESIFDV